MPEFTEQCEFQIDGTSERTGEGRQRNELCQLSLESHGFMSNSQNRNCEGHAFVTDVWSVYAPKNLRQRTPISMLLILHASRYS